MVKKRPRNGEMELEWRLSSVDESHLRSSRDSLHCWRPLFVSICAPFWAPIGKHKTRSIWPIDCFLNEKQSWKS